MVATKSSALSARDVLAISRGEAGATRDRWAGHTAHCWSTGLDCFNSRCCCTMLKLWLKLVSIPGFAFEDGQAE